MKTAILVERGRLNKGRFGAREKHDSVMNLDSKEQVDLLLPFPTLDSVAGGILPAPAVSWAHLLFLFRK